MYVYLCDFVCLVLLLPFVFGALSVHLFFLFPCHAAGRVLVFWPDVGPEHLRWESQVQDVRPPETSQPHIILIG